MPDIDVKAYVDQLRGLLPHVPPVSVEEIKALHQRRDFGAVVKLIRTTMNVGTNLTVHWTSGPPPKGLERANAWINLLPEKMPYYGTPAFKELKMDIFILNSFRDASTCGQFGNHCGANELFPCRAGINQPSPQEAKKKPSI